MIINKGEFLTYGHKYNFVEENCNRVFNKIFFSLNIHIDI